MNSLSALTAIGRKGRCEEIEGLVQLLAGDAGSCITGANPALNAGTSVMLRPNSPP
jgi:hypothetical protein